MSRAKSSTDQRLADITFEPIAGLEGADHEASLQKAIEVTRLAIDLLGKTKPELIEMVEAMSKHNEKGLVHAMLQGIRDGKGKLEAMLEFVTAAQCRVFSAAAVVYPAIDEAESPR